MLDIDEIDIASVAEALEDHSGDTTWWFNPSTGEVTPWVEDFADDLGEENPEDSGSVLVESYGSRDGYQDMQDFVALLGPGDVHDRLVRALQGRGVFRRFKDLLFEYPELQSQWLGFHDYRIKVRAIEWLVGNDHIETGQGQSAINALVEPEITSPVEPDHDVEPGEIARLQLIEHRARIVVEQARAIGWLEPTQATRPGLEEAIAGLADVAEPPTSS